MTHNSSTYIYESGASETVTLYRGPLTPDGKALLTIRYDDTLAADCYVDLAWLHNRAAQLHQNRPRVRKHNNWWRIFLGGHPTLDHYTSAATANNAAARLAAKEAAWR